MTIKHTRSNAASGHMLVQAPYHTICSNDNMICGLAELAPGEAEGGGDIEAVLDNNPLEFPHITALWQP